MPLPLEPSALQKKGWWLQQAHRVTSPLLLGCSGVLGQAVTPTGSGLLGMWPFAGKALSDLCIATAGSTSIIPQWHLPPQLGAHHSPAGLERILDALVQLLLGQTSQPFCECPSKDIPPLQPVMPGAKTLQPLLSTSCQPLCSMWSCISFRASTTE